MSQYMAVSQDSAAQPKSSHGSRPIVSGTLRYGSVILVVVAAILARAVLQIYLGGKAPYLIFFPALVL